MPNQDSVVNENQGGEPLRGFALLWASRVLASALEGQATGLMPVALILAVAVVAWSWSGPMTHRLAGWSGSSGPSEA